MEAVGTLMHEARVGLFYDVAAGHSQHGVSPGAVDAEACAGDCGVAAVPRAVSVDYSPGRSPPCPAVRRERGDARHEVGRDSRASSISIFCRKVISAQRDPLAGLEVACPAVPAGVRSHSAATSPCPMMRSTLGSAAIRLRSESRDP